MDWEDLEEGVDLQRIKVFGGWLVRTGIYTNGVSICFYPDPEHKWQ